MKKLIIGVCLLVLISSCGGGKKKIDPFEMLTEEIDSLAAVPDTVEVMEVVEEEPMVPATADESFADFIYNFAIDEKLQVSRIVFPLPYYTMDKKEHIEKKDWKHDRCSANWTLILFFLTRRWIWKRKRILLLPV